MTVDLWARQQDGRWHWKITDADGEILEESRPNGYQTRDQAVKEGRKRFPLWRDNTDWALIESA
ncbi:MAG: hypothetical protein KJN71_09525 [Acidimicrobiia bacterium]|nr:hypothetical protein [Acidimicrobiia bacterium]